MIKILFITIIISFTVSLISRIYIVLTSKTYISRVYKSKTTVRRAAEQMLHDAYPNITFELREGATDRYMWKTRTLELSEQMAKSNFMLGLASALHECGHALIHQKHPAISAFCSRSYLLLIQLTIPALICIVIGLIMQLTWLYGIGMGLYCLLFAWDLIAVIYEECASTTARAFAFDSGLLSAEEMLVFTKLIIAIDLCAFPMIYFTILALLKMFGLILLGKPKPDAAYVKS